MIRLRLLACITLLPPAFIAYAMARGHISFPFWDHIEVTRFIAEAMRGQLGLADLTAQHNEHRPATYRALVIGLAMLDGWDMRPEIAALWFLMVGTFTTLASGLSRFARDRTAILVGLPALSVIVFSPVAHNNQWWGMMLQLQLAALFLALGFVLHATGPRRLLTCVGAGIAITLAGYSLANGVLAFLALAGASAIVQRSARLAAAWITATAAFLAVYLHGYAAPPQTVHAGLLTTGAFALIALGAPLADLIRYPFTTEFEIPTATLFPGVVGAVILTFWISLAWLRIAMRQEDAATTFGFSVGIFAVANAVLIGFGRAASDAFGIANANASRYSTFDAFLLYALLAFAVSARSMRPMIRRSIAVAYGGMLCAASLAYAASLPVFNSVAAFDALLGNAYRDFDTETDAHHRIFPNSEHAAEMITLMRQLRIGPYRSGGEIRVPDPAVLHSPPAP